MITESKSPLSNEQKYFIRYLGSKHIPVHYHQNRFGDYKSPIYFHIAGKNVVVDKLSKNTKQINKMFGLELEHWSERQWDTKLSQAGLLKRQKRRNSREQSRIRRMTLSKMKMSI